MPARESREIDVRVQRGASIANGAAKGQPVDTRALHLFAPLLSLCLHTVPVHGSEAKVEAEGRVFENVINKNPGEK